MTAKDIVVFLDKLGMWDVILPFILIFTIVYAVLDKTKVLGEEDGEPKRRFNAIAAFVISAFTLLAVDVMNLVSRFSQYIVLLLVAGLLLAVLFGVFGFKDIGQKKIGKRVVIPLLFVGLILVMLYAFGWLKILDWSAIYRYSGVLIALAVFFFVIWIILREPTTTQTSATSPDTGAKAKSQTPEPSEPRTIRGMEPQNFLNIAQGLPESVKDEIEGTFERALKDTDQGKMVDIDAVLDGVSDSAKEEIKKRIKFK